MGLVWISSQRKAPQPPPQNQPHIEEAGIPTGFKNDRKRTPQRRPHFLTHSAKDHRGLAYTSMGRRET